MKPSREEPAPHPVSPSLPVFGTRARRYRKLHGCHVTLLETQLCDLMQQEESNLSGMLSWGVSAGMDDFTAVA